MSEEFSACIERMVTAYRAAGQACLLLMQQGFDIQTIVLAVKEHLLASSKEDGVTISAMKSMMEMGGDALDAADEHQQSVPSTIRTLERLLHEADMPHGQAPAIECTLLLAGMGAQAISGSLSETPEGGLRMLSAVHTDPRDPTGSRLSTFVEQYFNWGDVLVVAIQRRVTIEDRPLIFTGS